MLLLLLLLLLRLRLQYCCGCHRPVLVSYGRLVVWHRPRRVGVEAGGRRSLQQKI